MLCMLCHVMHCTDALCGVPCAADSRIQVDCVACVIPKGPLDDLLKLVAPSNLRGQVGAAHHEGVTELQQGQGGVDAFLFIMQQSPEAVNLVKQGYCTPLAWAVQMHCRK